ncbi:hypothetical protein K2173_027176 [Erythroxylum novogranatense]|uniref:SHSP domain-containing protein n=1 Tax=Erythroxylum novogranatense TaxID=1862640 RepID=A0AAV8U1B9_9ROSI|nr:hypothetical protein K2173_027176 [Erythroxylum novogranatense]
MTTPIRPFDMNGGISRPNPNPSLRHVIAVAPLNSMPYIDPPAPLGDRASIPSDSDTKPVERVGPSTVYFPSSTTQKEWDSVIDSTKNAVALAGSAAKGKVGPIVGLMDIGESEDAYLFRVSLPGVARDQKDFSFDINPDGMVHIKGVTTTGERTVCKHSQVFKMQTQNLCPPGRFAFTFQLPGPVNHLQFSVFFGTDGIFEGVVKKC